jgi:hypothetical protein
MLAGYPPFHESKKVPLFQQIKTAMFDFEDDAWNDISEEGSVLPINFACICNVSN